jgi:outer membrane protein TolC
MERSVMRKVMFPAGLALAAVFVSSVSVFGQSGQFPAAAVRRLSVDEAVRLAVGQNLGIRIERLNPEIQDVAIAQSRGAWVPSLMSSLNRTSTATAPTNPFAGGLNKITDARFETLLGVTQLLPTGGDYTVSWNSSRVSSSNFFQTFNPQLVSSLSVDFNQPLLRNFKVDNTRQQLELNRKIRENGDTSLQQTISQTVRNVRNAYWDLAFSINNLNAQRQSLDLSKRLLADNEKRVQIGTMAPIDIVEAQSEVARNEESVIVAEAAIKSAEDRLRALIFDPASPDFWTITIEPSDDAPFQVQAIDTDAAVRHALDVRTDIRQAKNGLEQNDISIRYLRNQLMPDVNANVLYRGTGTGGSRYQTDINAALEGRPPARLLVSERGYDTVIGDVFGAAFPTWTVGVTVGYPIGQSAPEANLARARLQHSQAQTQLRNLELAVATQVREAARTVQTNQKRIDSTRAARELAERRLEAAEKKFAAGIETSFFVFQAQRDLAQARTAEVRAISDYNKSLVDFEAVQEVPLGGGGGGITSVGAGASVAAIGR